MRLFVRIELLNIAQARFSIENDRWQGVLVIKAGKALSGKKCEVRVQFNAPTATSFDGDTVPPNELVLRIQPIRNLSQDEHQAAWAGQPAAANRDGLDA